MSGTDAGKDKLYAEMVLSSDRRGELRTLHDLEEGAGILANAADELEHTEPDLSEHYARKSRQLTERARELAKERGVLRPDETELIDRARQLEAEVANQHRNCSCHDNHPAHQYTVPAPTTIKLVLPDGRTIWFGSYTLMVDNHDGAITMTINDIIEES